MQNKADAMKAAPDPQAQAAKEKKLRDLEARKKELERVLGQLSGAS